MEEQEIQEVEMENHLEVEAEAAQEVQVRQETLLLTGLALEGTVFPELAGLEILLDLLQFLDQHIPM